METYESFASTTEANLGELQETVIQTFIEECDNKVILFSYYCYKLSFIESFYNVFTSKGIVDNGVD